jgi:ketosteroid isomerase-like protein
MKTFLSSLILLFIISATSFAQQAHNEQDSREKTPPGSGEVVQVLNDFRTAIINNDSEKASALLTDDIRILEGGNIETKEEYLSHHFHSDGKFLSAMDREVESRTITIEGNTAWVSTQTHTWGTYSDRKLDLNSLELAVLKKQKKGWKITALHWSSAQRN